MRGKVLQEDEEELLQVRGKIDEKRIWPVPEPACMHVKAQNLFLSNCQVLKPIDLGNPKTNNKIIG